MCPLHSLTLGTFNFTPLIGVRLASLNSSASGGNLVAVIFIFHFRARGIVIASNGKLRVVEFPLAWFIARTTCSLLDDTHSEVKLYLATSCGRKVGGVI